MAGKFGGFECREGAHAAAEGAGGDGVEGLVCQLGVAGHKGSHAGDKRAEDACQRAGISLTFPGLGLALVC